MWSSKLNSVHFFLILEIIGSVSAATLMDELLLVTEDSKLEPDKTAIFQEYQTLYSKTYESTTRISSAFDVVSNRIDQIVDHNQEYAKGESTFRTGLNEYSDLSETEFNNKLNSFVVVLLQGKSLPQSILNTIQVPASLNYTALGHVTTIRNQGTCGSCWSFSTTGMLEGQIFKKTGILTKLSEQNLIDCNKNLVTGNFGCSGGNMLVAYQHIITTGGISKSANYPYRAADTFACTYNPAFTAGAVASYDILPPGNEYLVQQHLVYIGPLSIALDASLPSFQNYVSGVYADPACSNVLNHAMLLVGYGTDTTLSPPVNYWIVKNTYGTTWGERGYIRIKRGVNMCGIADYVTYALVV